MDQSQIHVQPAGSLSQQLHAIGSAVKAITFVNVKIVVCFTNLEKKITIKTNSTSPNRTILSQNGSAYPAAASAASIFERV
jgi:hypothetical protein